MDKARLSSYIIFLRAKFRAIGGIFNDIMDCGMMKKTFIWALLALGLPALAWESRADENEVSKEALAAAKTNFEDFCASCHAANGAGDI